MNKLVPLPEKNIAISTLFKVLDLTMKGNKLQFDIAFYFWFRQFPFRTMEMNPRATEIKSSCRKVFVLAISRLDSSMYPPNICRDIEESYRPQA
jgi:hypothetical protein